MFCLAQRSHHVRTITTAALRCQKTPRVKPGSQRHGPQAGGQAGEEPPVVTPSVRWTAELGEA
eukprot:6086731-Prorocentrum_lima.AAC.1